MIVHTLVKLGQDRRVSTLQGYTEESCPLDQERTIRLSFILPKVEPTHVQLPNVCPQPGCKGKHFKRFQEVIKLVRDTNYAEVKAYRHCCLRCGHIFRIYLVGVCRDHFSQRLRGLAVVLYLVGLSYGTVSLVMEALGLSMSKTLY